jgi:NADPH2:quinone reductase
VFWPSWLPQKARPHARKLTGGVDAAIDLAGNAAAASAFDAIKDGGKYVTVNPHWWRPGGVFDERRGILPTVLFVRPNGPDLERVSKMVDSGELKLRTEAIFPLQDVAAAHRRLAEGHLRGKLILVP